MTQERYTREQFEATLANVEEKQVSGAAEAGGAGGGGMRHPIGDSYTLAEDKDMAARAYMCIPNTPETYPKRIDVVPHALSFYAAVGGDEAYYPIHLEKMLEYEGNDEEFARNIWDSGKGGTTVGALDLFFKAEKYGFTEHLEARAAQAQADFDDGISSDPPAKIVA